MSYRKAMIDWEAANSKEYDPTGFTTRILPVTKLTSATRLSHLYCALVKHGEQVPHPVQWDARTTDVVL